MGCRESKTECSIIQLDRRCSNATVAGRLQGDTDTPPLTEVDPRLPFNVRDVYRLKQSWKAIRRNMEETGVEMFINLFRSDNNMLKLFQSLSDFDDHDFRENETLEAHALLVMNTLDNAFSNIEKYDYVVESLMEIGATHIRFPGFEDYFFHKMEEPFLNAMRLTLGDRYSEKIAELYQLAITFILDNLQKGMREARERKNQRANIDKVPEPSTDVTPPPTATCGET